MTDPRELLDAYAEAPDPPGAEVKHRIQTAVVNGIHLLECRTCGRRWLPVQQTPTQGPDASTCPGSQR